MLIKKSISLYGHRTSFSLEKEFEEALKEIAHARNISYQKLIESIDEEKKEGNLSSAIRVYILNYYRFGS